MASYQRINYLLRPAKHIERRMIADSLRRLGVLFPLENYRYIGFGANTFGDFLLFHRQFGMSDMISIEEEASDALRFELNKPFAAITMAYGVSDAVLPEIGWDPPTIIWLDYDKQLDASKLADIRLVVGAAVPGSAVLVTLCAAPESRAAPLAELRNRVGPEAVPSDLTDADLEGWGFAKACRRVVGNAIEDTLRDRNQEREDDQKVAYLEFADFEYQDGVRMMTLGGALVRPHQQAELEAGGITNLDWYRPGATPYRINTPPLTIREMRHLNSQLPCDPSSLSTSGIPEADARDYSAVYRFYPTYVDADV